MTRQKNNKAENGDRQTSTEKQNVGQKGRKTKRRPEIQIKPSNVRYSQCSIANTFSDGGKIMDLVEDIQHGKCFVSAIPTISVIRMNGKWYSADNRRLWVFKELERNGHLRTIKVKVSKHMFPGKMTTKNDGTSIEIRKGGKTDDDNKVVQSTDSHTDSDWRSGHEYDYTDSESGDFEESSDEENDLVGARGISSPSSCYQPYVKPLSFCHSNYENDCIDNPVSLYHNRHIKETNPAKPTVGVAIRSSFRAADEVKPRSTSRPNTSLTSQNLSDTFDDLLRIGSGMNKLVDLYNNRQVGETKPARPTVGVAGRNSFRATDEFSPRSSSKPKPSSPTISYDRRNLFDDFDGLSRTGTGIYREGRHIYSSGNPPNGHSSSSNFSHEIGTSRSREPYQNSGNQDTFFGNRPTPSYQRESHAASKKNQNSDDSLCTIL